MRCSVLHPIPSAVARLPASGAFRPPRRPLLPSRGCRPVGCSARRVVRFRGCAADGGWGVPRAGLSRSVVARLSGWWGGGPALRAVASRRYAATRSVGVVSSPPCRLPWVRGCAAGRGPTRQVQASARTRLSAGGVSRGRWQRLPPDAAAASSARRGCRGRSPREGAVGRGCCFPSLRPVSHGPSPLSASLSCPGSFLPVGGVFCSCGRRFLTSRGCRFVRASGVQGEEPPPGCGRAGVLLSVVAAGVSWALTPFGLAFLPWLVPVGRWGVLPSRSSPSDVARLSLRPRVGGAGDGVPAEVRAGNSVAFLSPWARVPHRPRPPLGIAPLAPGSRPGPVSLRSVPLQPLTPPNAPPRGGPGACPRFWGRAWWGRWARRNGRRGYVRVTPYPRTYHPPGHTPDPMPRWAIRAAHHRTPT